MIYLYLFGTCFHFIYVFMIIRKYYHKIRRYWSLEKYIFLSFPTFTYYNKHTYLYHTDITL